MEKEDTFETMPEVENVKEVQEETVAIKEEEEFVEVKFNKQKLHFNDEEAIPLIEMGLKWESFKEHYEKLVMLANANGVSAKEFIDVLKEAYEDIVFREALEVCGNDEKAAISVFKESLGEAYEDIELLGGKDEKTEKLFNEFLELQSYFPEFVEFEKVPEKVVMDAIENQRELLDSYLRFTLEKHINSMEASVNQDLLNGRSSGSLHSDSPIPAELISFEKAFRNALD